MGRVSRLSADTPPALSRLMFGCTTLCKELRYAWRAGRWSGNAQPFSVEGDTLHITEGGVKIERVIAYHRGGGVKIERFVAYHRGGDVKIERVIAYHW